MRPTGALYSALAGNMGAVIVGGVVSVVLTLMNPDNDFNWESTRALNNADHFIHEAAATSGPLQKIAVLDEKEKSPSDGDAAEEQSQQESTVQEFPVRETPYDLAKGAEYILLTPLDPHIFATPAFRFATISSVGMTLVLLLVSSL